MPAKTYYLANTARGKLSLEASRIDHDLRLLVGHAIFLDHLMIELEEATQEQEVWLERLTRNGHITTGQKHIQHADTLTEEPEEV